MMPHSEPLRTNSAAGIRPRWETMPPEDITANLRDDANAESLYRATEQWKALIKK